MNAIDLLLKEHTQVRKMMANIKSSSHSFATKKKLFKTLKADLLRHEKMEETVWYPYLRSDKKLMSEISHLISEEVDAEKALKKLDHVNKVDEWETKFSKLSKDVEHHASEEETELFPEVVKTFSEDLLEKIGAEMYAFKKQYKMKMHH